MTMAVTNSRLDNATYLATASLQRPSADQHVLVCDIVLFLSIVIPLCFFFLLENFVRGFKIIM